MAFLMGKYRIRLANNFVAQLGWIRRTHPQFNILLGRIFSHEVKV